MSRNTRDRSDAIERCNSEIEKLQRDIAELEPLIKSFGVSDTGSSLVVKPSEAGSDVSHGQKARSCRSQNSTSTHGSAINSGIFMRQKAKVEAARVKLEFTSRENDLKKEQMFLESTMNLLTRSLGPCVRARKSEHRTRHP